MRRRLTSHPVKNIYEGSDLDRLPYSLPLGMVVEDSYHRSNGEGSPTSEPGMKSLNLGIHSLVRRYFI